jgi:hypothetical protein
MLSTPIHYRPATPKESPMNMECIVGSIRCASGSASSARASRSQKGWGPLGSVPGRGRGAGRYIPQASGADSLLEEAGLKLLVPLRGLVPIALSKMTGKPCCSRLGTSTG